jgi:copper chaperone CopZ
MTCQSCVDAVRKSLQGVAGKNGINLSVDSPEASGKNQANLLVQFYSCFTDAETDTQRVKEMFSESQRPRGRV